MDELQMLEQLGIGGCSEGNGMIRSERMVVDHSRIVVNCSGRVAIEQGTDCSMPLRSMEARRADHRSVEIGLDIPLFFQSRDGQRRR